ncbi:hypothetical protein ACRAWD_18410 [Caulobacter segnis]
MTGPVGTTADPGVMARNWRWSTSTASSCCADTQGTLYGSGAMGGALRILFRLSEPAETSAAVGVSASAAAHGGQSRRRYRDAEHRGGSRAPRGPRQRL